MVEDLASENDPALKQATTTGLQKLADAALRQKRPPISSILLSLNAVFDSVSLEGNPTFHDTLSKIEQHLLTSITTQQYTLSTLTDSAYLFCKFQSGSKQLWQAIESAIARNVDNFTMEQLARLVLALTMNDRPFDPKLLSTMFFAVLDKIDKAKSKDAFYLGMALGRGLGKKFNADQIKQFSDLCYNLYLVTAKEIQNFDLFQLAQIANLMCAPQVSPSVPDEFWTNSLEPVLDEHLANFVKYSDQLDRPTYLADFVKCLVGFGVREISTPLFLAKVERVIMPHISELDSKTLEGLLFFLMRAGTRPTPAGASTRNVEILEEIMRVIGDREMLLRGEVNDHFAIMQVLNQNAKNINSDLANKLFDHLDQVVSAQCFGKDSLRLLEQDGLPKEALFEIASLYAFEFSRSQGEFDRFFKPFFSFLEANHA
jgi:hypothetical protein